MTAAARFAATIRARHRPARNQPAPLPRVLRRTMVFVAGQHRHMSVMLAPKFQFAVGQTHRSTHLLQRVQRVGVSAQPRLASQVHSRAMAFEYRPARANNQLRRDVHASAAVPQSNRTVVRVERIAHAERLPRVLQRMPRVEEKPPRQNEPMIRRGPELPISLPAAELERVTTHVVRTLDRRLTAWRERSGRI
jgi:hypothetical protein